MGKCRGHAFEGFVLSLPSKRWISCDKTLRLPWTVLFVATSDDFLKWHDGIDFGLDMMTQMDMRRLHHTLFSYDRSAAKPLPFAATPWPIHYLKHEQNLTLRLGSRKEHFHIHNVGAQKHFKANVTTAQEKSLAPQTPSRGGPSQVRRSSGSRMASWPCAAPGSV